MKAERKHELQHNELDDLLQKVAAFLRDHGAILGILVAVVLLAVLTYNLLLAERPMNASAGKWNDFFYALSDKDSTDELTKFIDDEKKATDPPVLWARLALADKQLAQASQQVFEDRKAAKENLEKAEKNYREVENTRVPELRDRARIGLAQVYESQNKPDEALKYYDMVLKSSPETPAGKIAARGHKRLSEEGNREFLDWFVKQEPIKKATRPGATPFGLPGLSDSPDFSVPPVSPQGESPLTPGFKLPSDPSGANDDPAAFPTPPEKNPPPPVTPPSSEDTGDAPKEAPAEPKSDTESKPE